MTLRSKAVVITSLFSLITFSPLSAQDPLATEPAGRFGTLPGTDGAELQGDVLVGRVRLLGTALDDAIAGLQDADVRQFTHSYRHMVRAYGQLGDQLGDAGESIGDARARIDLAERALDALGALEQSDPQRRRQLSEDIGAVREQLLAKLGALRQHYEKAMPDEKKKILAQIAVVVGRIEQLDQLRGSVAKGQSPVVPPVAAHGMTQQLDAMKQALDEEERSLEVLSNSISLLVETTTNEMYRSIRVLEIEARIPRDQMRQLADTRAAVNETLRQLTDAQRVASESVMNILTRGAAATGVAVEPDVLLRQADELLRNVNR